MQFWCIFGNFLDLKIIFGEMFLEHGIYDKILFFQFFCEK